MTDRQGYVVRLAELVEEELAGDRPRLGAGDLAAAKSLIESGDLKPGHRWERGTVSRERYEQIKAELIEQSPAVDVDTILLIDFDEVLMSVLQRASNP